MATTTAEPPASSPPKRVVSLLGAATEVIFRLGLGHRLVGRSHECDYPPAVLSLPMISRPRLDPLAPSRAIDDAVRAHAAVGEPVYALDDGELASLMPDLLITWWQPMAQAQTRGRLATVATEWKRRPRRSRETRRDMLSVVYI